MGDISITVDEVRRMAAKMATVVPDQPHLLGFSVTDQPHLLGFSVTDQPDLNPAVAEFTGCINDCTAERRRGVEALVTGLREVADMFESLDAGAQADLRALGAVEGWVLE